MEPYLHYLQIVIFLSLALWVGLYFYYFIRQKKSDTFLLSFTLWIILILFFHLAFYYLIQELNFFSDLKENFLWLGWILTFLLFLEERTSHKNDKSVRSAGVFITPLIVFINLLGIILVSSPELISITKSQTNKIIENQFQSLMLLGGKVFYFYAIILTIINYRLYSELKYHLPLFFSSRLPTINKMDFFINRYLFWGSLLFGISIIVSIWLHYSAFISFFSHLFFKKNLIKNPETLNYHYLIDLHDFFLVFLTLGYFVMIRLLRWKKILTIKINLLLLTSGAFLLLFISLI